MSTLGVIDPPACDERGVPLDWERCRKCAGSGKMAFPKDLNDPSRAMVCPACDGHGSLKRAALVKRVMSLAPSGSFSVEEFAKQVEPRCEDCGHPMSEGTWEWDDGSCVSEQMKREALEDAFRDLLRGADLLPDLTYYSSCKEGCKHGGPLRLHDPDDGWLEQDAEHVSHFEQTGGGLVALGHVIEASWRSVNVHTLGWPHDLRPEKLAVLCLRCYAERVRS